jgi:hypothetical protein
MRIRIAGVAACLLLACGAYAAERSQVITQTYPATPGKVVLVDAGRFEVAVRAAEIEDIRLHVEVIAGGFSGTKADLWVKSHTPTITDKPEELRIEAPDPSGSSLFKGILSTLTRIELVLPTTAVPDITTGTGDVTVEGEFAQARPLRLRSASGTLAFVGWAPEVEARSTSGAVKLQASRAFERLLIRTASGGATLTGGAHHVACDTSSGDVQLAGLLGTAAVSTTSGRVVAGFDALAPTDEVRITTANGAITLTLPPGTDPSGDVASPKGEINSRSTGQIDTVARTLKLSGTGPKLFLISSSGRITIQ